MAATTIVTLRIPQSFVDRSEALIDALARDEEAVMLGRVSRSIVMRLAILRGLEVLEGQVSGRAAAKEKGKKPTGKTRG